MNAHYPAAIHGDRDAYEMIIRAHGRTLFAIAYGILQNREEAEDLVREFAERLDLDRETCDARRR